MLNFVFPSRDVSWRLNWYNELKMPMLSTAMLTDEGKANLKKKMREFIDLLANYPTTSMEINTEDKNQLSTEELTSEERLLTLTLHKAKLHTKAKVIIFAKLDEIERKRLLLGKEMEPRDMHEMQVDFEEV